MRQLFTIFVCIAFFSLFVQAEVKTKKKAGPQMKLTAEQRDCITNPDTSGLPQGAAKPTHEEMLAAMTKCNINVDQTLTSLRSKYQASETEDQRDEIKADMRTIFYATDSNEVKQKVREFFRDNRENVQNSERTPASSPTVGVK